MDVNYKANVEPDNQGTSTHCVQHLFLKRNHEFSEA
jgi:hypothetical protein